MWNVGVKEQKKCESRFIFKSPGVNKINELKVTTNKFKKILPRTWLQVVSSRVWPASRQLDHPALEYS
jgi:hypothetical protein